MIIYTSSVYYHDTSTSQFQLNLIQLGEYTIRMLSQYYDSLSSQILFDNVKNKSLSKTIIVTLIDCF